MAKTYVMTEHIRVRNYPRCRFCVREINVGQEVVSKINCRGRNGNSRIYHRSCYEKTLY